MQDSTEEHPISGQRICVFVEHLLVIDGFLGEDGGLDVDVVLASECGRSVIPDEDVSCRITAWLQRLSISCRCC